MLRRLVAFFFFVGLACLSPLWAQTEGVDSAYLAEIDSLMQVYEEEQQVQKVAEAVKQYEATRLHREMSFSPNGLLPVVRGLIVTWTDHHFIQQDTPFPRLSDRLRWSDYAVAGSPLLVNWALKAAGVKSRSKVERMLTANAMALGLSFGTTELLKQAVDEGRPDQSDRRSFPSGHAALAFVSASVLSREYGHLSPWVPVGSYTVATGTQLLRIRHNKHWMNDLYMGAGIGMVSTNLAYFLTDRIFGADAINRPEIRRRDVLRLMQFNTQPTGIALVSGTEVGDRTIRFGDAYAKAGAAVTAGFDAAWFVSSSAAVELMARVVDAQLKVYGTPHPFVGDHLDLCHFDVAAKWSTPLSLDKRFGTRVMAGTRLLGGAALTDGATTYSIPREARFECGMGINFYCLDTENYAWGFTADYYHTFSHYMKNRYSISSVWKIVF